MKIIKLTQNQVTVVDDNDFKYLSQFEWYAYKHKSGNFYAVRNVKINGKTTMIRMSRVILNASKNIEVDHHSGDTLDNRKTNLRKVTHHQNCMNQSKHRDSSSPFKGIRKNNNKWQAKICFKGVNICLGSYKDPVEAALAYDIKAVELFGRFAKLNFQSSL